MTGDLLEKLPDEMLLIDRECSDTALCTLIAGYNRVVLSDKTGKLPVLNSESTVKDLKDAIKLCDVSVQLSLVNCFINDTRDFSSLQVEDVREAARFRRTFVTALIKLGIFLSGVITGGVLTIGVIVGKLDNPLSVFVFDTALELIKSIISSI